MKPTLQTIALMFGSGLVTGTLSGIFGIGGGVILVPLLVLLFGFSQHSASGTSLVAMLLPVGVLGVYQYYLAGKINADNIKFGLIIALGIFLGTYLGSRIAIGLPEMMMRRSFAIFMGLVALKVWFT